MESEKIANITDEEWAKADELGQVEKVIEYQTGTGLKKVRVIAKILSGSQTRAIEVAHTTEDEVNGIKLDSDAYMNDLICKTCGLTADQFQRINDNKSGDLLSKLRTLTMEITGMTPTEEEIESEKK